MNDFLQWAIFIIMIGWMVFPITFHFFGKTVEKGFSISKIIGLLFWGYFYWLGNIFHIIDNSQISAIFVLLVIGLVSWHFFKKDKLELGAWITCSKGIIIFYEIFFLLTFLCWAIVRGANPEIIGTEKPMELAFINGILRSPTFPPNDPWLSGYSISYYYFGYLLVAMLMHVFSTPSGVAFNLAVALIFSLTAVASSGILLNIIAPIKYKASGEKQPILNNKKLLGFSLLAPLFILVVSNGAGALEMLHSRGIFWDIEEDQAHSEFWKWLDIQELNDSPSLPLDWFPSRAGGTWWWRASRVLQDYTVDGQPREIIDEFPFFSFLLADLHPHLISLPFVMVNIYLGYYLFTQPEYRLIINGKWKQTISQPFFWLTALMVGSLIFINTWDFPIYFLLISLCLFIPAYQELGNFFQTIKNLIGSIFFLGLACIILFLPFLIGLSSQASGLVPSLIFRTRGIHYLIMFLPHIILLIFLIIVDFKKYPLKPMSRIFLFLFLGFVVIFIGSLFYINLLEKIPQWLMWFGNKINQTIDQGIVTFNAPLLNLFRIYGAKNSQELIAEAIRRIIHNPYVLIFQAVIIAVSWVTLFTKKNLNNEENFSIELKNNQFIFLLVFMAAVLSVFPELFYLKDQFGWRMNTIFKFYYQIWVLFSFVSASIVYKICHLDKTIWCRAGLLITGLILVISMIYPFFAIKDKTNMFKNIEYSLDGNKYLELTQPSEYEASQFLTTIPFGVVSEAIGGSYSNYARISRLSGYPTVLGWPGHEVQWRGGVKEIGSREMDIQRLYSTMDWGEAESIIETYGIKYVFIGDLENQTYAVNEEKFRQNMVAILNQQGATLYSTNTR